MDDPAKTPRDEIEALGKDARQTLERLGREFQANVRALIAKFANRPDELHQRMAELQEAFENDLRRAHEAVEAAIASRVKGRRPRPRRPYVEVFAPRPKRPRRPRRPSAGGILVTPDKPKGLSGGAAVPLDVD